MIETDKYIGIILEYASGGELFDHILAHRYLREKDAAKLFSQLISGVWYIHQKKIVHRDLKLENLLLDRHRNVIITDFGFANRFEHRSDDLMQTSCGSPCYAAPELVISEGLYVGSAVDIWSCGVILYAMLAGYLPFDDDPANPDGDNINLLYKYIVSTPLSFPDYISMEARDLLSMMLVPDPARRTTLDGVMRHPWLSLYHQTRTDGLPNAFGKTVDDLERQALEQHQQRRLAYQRQMRANAVANGAAPSPSRTQSHRPDHGAAAPSASRSRSTQPEYLYDSSADQSIMSPASAVQTTPTHNGAPKKNYGSPAALGLSEDDPFAGPGGSVAPNTAVPVIGSSSKPRTSDDASRVASSTLSPNATSPKGHKSNNSGGGAGFRHTIQVEYDDPSKTPRRSEDKRRDRAGSQGQSSIQQQQPQIPTQQSPQQNGIAVPTVPNTPAKERRPSQSNAKPLPPSPPSTTNNLVNTPSAYRPSSTPKSATTSPSNNLTPAKGSRPTELNGIKQPTPDSLVVNISSPPPTPSLVSPSEQREQDKDSGSQKSSSSRKPGHKKGKSSLDRIGLSKIFGGGGNNANANLTPSPTLNGGDVKAGSQDGSTTPVPSDGRGSATSVLLTPVANEKESSGRKSRRNTLTVMVEPFTRSVRNRKGKTTSTPLTTDGASAANAKHPKPALTESPQSKSNLLPPTLTTTPVVDPTFSPAQEFGGGVDANGMQASTSKARKVMQWFRTKSKGRDSVGFGAEEDSEVPSSSKEKGGTPTQAKYKRGFSASSSTVNHSTSTSLGLNETGMAPVKVVVTTPNSAAPIPHRATGHAQRSASSATEASASFVSRFRNSVNVGGSSHQREREADKSHPYGQLRVHHGAVDHMMVTTKAPPEVMAHVKKILQGMGVETQLESEYKFRCIRAKKRKGTMGHSAGASASTATASGNGLAAVTLVGTAASNGVSPLIIACMSLLICHDVLLRRRLTNVVCLCPHHRRSLEQVECFVGCLCVASRRRCLIMVLRHPSLPWRSMTRLPLL